MLTSTTTGGGGEERQNNFNSSTYLRWRNKLYIQTTEKHPGLSLVLDSLLVPLIFGLKRSVLRSSCSNTDANRSSVDMVTRMRRLRRHGSAGRFQRGLINIVTPTKSERCADRRNLGLEMMRMCLFYWVFRPKHATKASWRHQRSILHCRKRA